MDGWEQEGRDGQGTLGTGGTQSLDGDAGSLNPIFLRVRSPWVLSWKPSTLLLHCPAPEKHESQRLFPS